MANYYIPKSTKKWDFFLTEKYGYGIYEFSYSLADMIIFKNTRYLVSPQEELPRRLLTSHSEYLRDEIEMRENLKYHIIHRLFDSNKDMWGGMKKPEEWVIKDIKEIYKLEPFFEKLDKEIRILKKETGRKGRPPETRNFIASIWAEVMKDREKSFWHRIEQLFIWFYYKLEKTRYCNVLGTDAPHKSDFDRFNLRNGYYRIKKDKQKRESLNLSRNYYFPITRKYPYDSIEFNKDYINFISSDEAGFHLKFPDGEVYNEFLTIKEICEKLKVSRTSVYRYFKRGLEFHKIGRSVRIRKADLNKFIKQNKI
jgi:excisionase family DNA binding protein